MLQKISDDWRGGFCIVAASGPSLTPDIAAACRGHRVVAVSDAYRLLPDADILYSCDSEWWHVHQGCVSFKGERWSSHGDAFRNDKRKAAKEYGLNLVRGCDGEGFSFDPALIHYGNLSGFQAVNLAGHKIGWHGRIALVGFDMRQVDGVSHFFGDHPKGLRKQTKYEKWAKHFAAAAKTLPPTVEIVNCTPGSAITCFRMMDIHEAPPAPARH